MDEKPNYYAIIPADVRYDEKLKLGEKMMYGEITALSKKNGICYASNNYFAKLYNVSPQAISKWIKNLEKNNYISISYERDGKAIIKRNISMVSTQVDRVSTEVEGGINSGLEGYQQEIKENNTSNNNTSINNKEIYKERFEVFYKAYPKHLKKAEVEKWFLKNKPDETLFKTIMTQLEKFKQTKEWSNTQYIPYPSTWLNQKRWEDQIETKEDRDKKLIEELKQWEVENGYRTS